MDTRTRVYLKLSELELEEYDDIGRKNGYETRTDFTTYIIKSVIENSSTHTNLTGLQKTLEVLSEQDTLHNAFIEALEDFGYPVVAMHGADVAYKALASDLKSTIYSKCQLVPEDSELKMWIDNYCMEHKEALQQYRRNRATANYEEEFGLTRDNQNPNGSMNYSTNDSTNYSMNYSTNGSPMNSSTEFPSDLFVNSQENSPCNIRNNLE